MATVSGPGEDGADRAVHIHATVELYWPRWRPGTDDPGPTTVLQRARRSVSAENEAASTVTVAGRTYRVTMAIEVGVGFDPSVHDSLNPWHPTDSMVGLYRHSVRLDRCLFACVRPDTRGVPEGIYGQTARQGYFGLPGTVDFPRGTAGRLVVPTPFIGQAFLHELGHMMGLGEGYVSTPRGERTRDVAAGTPMGIATDRWGSRFSPRQRSMFVLYALRALQHGRERGTPRGRWGPRFEEYRARERGDVGELF